MTMGVVIIMSDISGPTPKHRKNIPVQVIAIVVLMIVIGAVVVVAIHPIPPKSTIGPATVQPSFHFLSPNYLSVAYGRNITSENYTSNLTSSVYANISTMGVVKGEMYLYGANASSSSAGSLVVGIVLLELSSSSDANVSFQNFSMAMHKVNGVTISYGNVSGFRFINVTDNSTSFPYSIYYAVDGNWVLLIQFAGQATAHELTVFEAQVSLMLRPPPS